MSYNEWILNKLSVKFWSSPYIVQKGLWAQRNHGVVPLLTFPKLPAEGAEDISLPAQLSPTLSIPACSHARSPNPHFIYNVKSAFLPPTKVTCCPLSTSVNTEGSAPGKSSAPAPYVLFQGSGSSIPLRLSPGCFPGAQKQKPAMATGRQQAWWWT